MNLTYLKIKPSGPKKSVSRKTDSIENYSWVLSSRSWETANDGMNRLSITPATNFPGQLKTLRKKTTQFVFWSLFPRRHIFFKEEKDQNERANWDNEQLLLYIPGHPWSWKCPFASKATEIIRNRNTISRSRCSKNDSGDKKSRKKRSLFWNVSRNVSWTWKHVFQCRNSKLAWKNGRNFKVFRQKNFSPFFSKIFTSITFKVV